MEYSKTLIIFLVLYIFLYAFFNASLITPNNAPNSLYSLNYSNQITDNFGYNSVSSFDAIGLFANMWSFVLNFLFFPLQFVSFMAGGVVNPYLGVIIEIFLIVGDIAVFYYMSILLQWLIFVIGSIISKL